MKWIASGLAVSALALAQIVWAQPVRAGQSVYLTAPADPAAITVHATGDGLTDDTAALQSAIDQAAKSGEGGLVFLPSGRYRITRTLLIRAAVRLFGTGPTRPVLVLADNTPGFQEGISTMVVFTGDDQYKVGQVPVPVPTVVPIGDQVRDANSATFYSALANVDFEIGKDNPAAAAVRFRTAQHTFLSHIDFHLGSGLAGIYQAGNECEDLHFYGGRYGIITEKTSPAWQFTLVDSTFEGQSAAAIREHEVDLTLVNVAIKNTPIGIDIDRGYSDSLWGRDVTFDKVSDAAVVISNEASVFTQIGFDHAVARDTPIFARFRDSGKTLAAPGNLYEVKAFSYGLKVDQPGRMGDFVTQFDAQTLKRWPKPAARAIALLPPVAQWTNVHTLGVVGDGATDDTAAIQKAINSHRILYFPLGRYVVSDTLRLKPDSILIGLHPSLTQFIIPDATPAFAGVGDAKGLIESASGGNAILSGFGLFTGGVNPRASALIWQAGEHSLVDDVRIQGGHGTILAGGARFDPYNANQSTTPDPQIYWDRQHPSIWVRDGGGGTFANIWTPNTNAQAGFYVTNTKTPGHVYELSAEHHVRAEIVLDGVENWEFLAPQTEEEVRESQDTVSMEVRNSRNILFANYHGYRVTRTVKPAPSAVRLFNSSDIRFRNVHVNAESGYAGCDDNGCGTYLRASKYPFENAIEDVTHGLTVREREFASLDITAAQAPAAAPTPGVTRVSDGFYSIAGAAVDSKGKLYFIDRRFQRIYGWTKADGLSVAADAPLDPINLAVDASDNLLVLSSAGPEATVYSLKPGQFGVAVIVPTPVAEHPGASVALPVNYWNNGEFRDQLDPKTYEFTTLAQMFARDTARPKTREYVSPDGSLVLPAFRVIKQGPVTHLGWRFSDTLDTYGFVSGKPGQRIVFTNGSENRTYSGIIAAGGALSDLHVIAERGGEGAAVDSQGRIYVANGQIFVYAAEGKPLQRIDVPDRPLQLLFGGPDGRTLFILTHHALYTMER